MTAGALVAIVVALKVGGWGERTATERGPSPVASLAVLPLEDLSADPGQEYFTDGLTDASLRAKAAAMRAVELDDTLADAHYILGNVRLNDFDWLERAYEERDVQLTYLKGAPALDSLRAEPRFIALLEKMNLAP